jgi:hypothetical protein
MNEQTKLELDAVDQRADEILARVEQLAGNLDEESFELIEPDLTACLETMAIAGELTDLAALVELEESSAGATQPAAEAPLEDKDGNSLLSFLTQLFSGFPETVVNLIAKDKKVAAKNEQKPEGDCCVDVEERCMAKDNAQGEQTPKKLPLAEDPQITICIAPSTSEYFKDMKPSNSDSKDEKNSQPEGKPVGKLRPAHPEDQLGLSDALGDPEADGGMCMEDENGAYTCIIVPSHKDLASSLLKGARRMLGFSDKALGNAEAKLPKKGDSTNSDGNSDKK